MAQTSVFILAPDFPELEGSEMLGGAYAQSLSTAKRMGYDGAEIVMGVPGRPMRWFKDCLVDVLREAAAYAAQLQVAMVFEYTNRFEINTINTGVEAREIVDQVGSSNLGILIDTGHSFLEDPDVYQNILDLNGRVWHFHLHDSNGGAAIVGGGENDFDRIMQVCRQIGYHN